MYLNFIRTVIVEAAIVELLLREMITKTLQTGAFTNKHMHSCINLIQDSILFSFFLCQSQRCFFYSWIKLLPWGQRDELFPTTVLRHRICSAAKIKLSNNSSPWPFSETCGPYKSSHRRTLWSTAVFCLCICALGACVCVLQHSNKCVSFLHKFKHLFDNVSIDRNKTWLCLLVLVWVAYVSGCLCGAVSLSTLRVCVCSLCERIKKFQMPLQLFILIQQVKKQNFWHQAIISV